MTMRKIWFPAILVIAFTFLNPFARAAERFRELEVTGGGAVRTALVHVPPQAKTSTTPVVFVFHGFGSSAKKAADQFPIDRLWPEAISVYMQGLDTPSQLSPRQGRKPGWQAGPGDQRDRDIKFFDAVLARLEQDFRIDTRHIYATGHSNGGCFVYLLWLTRPQVFASVAPSAAAAIYGKKLTPKPAMILGGRKDPVVKTAWQQMMIGTVRKINGCAKTGEPWGDGCTLYPSAIGTPLITFIHPGGHQPDPAEPGLIVKFFKGRS